MAQTQQVALCPERPGISKMLSELSLGDRWTDCDKVRFVDGKPEKINGNEVLTLTTVTDPIRGMRAWSTQRLQEYIAMGTHRKLYVVDDSYDPFDITPIAESGNLTNPFTVTTGSAIVTVADTAHGRAVGDEVRFSGASAIGATGMTINGTYVVAVYVNANSYKITHTATSSGDGTGGGTVAYEYELSIGSEDPLVGNGYGSGGYGVGNYGEPTSTVVAIVDEPRTWSIPQYGDYVICSPTYGGLYLFDPTDLPAYVKPGLIVGAPTSVRSVFVTPERFVFALGCDNDPMLVKWPDLNNIEDWTATESNTANERRLREGTRIVGGSGIANLQSGVWTDTAMYIFQFTGQNAVYDSRLVGTNCGLVSPLALVVHLNVAYWMSQNGFYYWSGGSPQSIPNSEDVAEFVTRMMRTGGWEFKNNAHYNARFDEIWWFYVANDDAEPSYYVACSLKDYSWVVGTMVRTCGDFFKSSDQRPVLGGADGFLYQHEEGKDDNGDVMKAYITRAPMQFIDGAAVGEVHGVVCDFQRHVGPVEIEMTLYERMNEAYLERETEQVDPGEDLADFRVGGRIVSVTVTSAALGGDFRLGSPLLEVKRTGKRR